MALELGKMLISSFFKEMYVFILVLWLFQVLVVAW